MESNITVAIVSASSAVIVSVVALVANVVWMGRSFTQLDKRLSLIETDLREFYKILNRHDKDIALLRQHTGLKGQE
jgi:hypothetical protein